MSKQSDTSKLVRQLRARLGAAIARAKLAQAEPVPENRPINVALPNAGRKNPPAPYRRRMLMILDEEPQAFDNIDPSELMLDPLTNLYLRANRIDFLNQVMSIPQEQDEAAVQT